MKKGNSINETLILLQQDIREFYGVMPHEFTAKGKLPHYISHARSAFCCIAFKMSPNLYSTDTLAKVLKRNRLQIYQFIQQGQNLSDLKDLKSHLKKQGWKI